MQRRACLGERRAVGERHVEEDAVDNLGVGARRADERELPDAGQQPDGAVVGVCVVASVGAQAGLVVGQRSHEGVDEEDAQPLQPVGVDAGQRDALWRDDGAHEAEERRERADAEARRARAIRLVEEAAAHLQRLLQQRGGEARRHARVVHAQHELGGEHQREVAAVGAVRLPRREQLEEHARRRVLQPHRAKEPVRRRGDGDGAARLVGADELGPARRAVAGGGEVADDLERNSCGLTGFLRADDHRVVGLGGVGGGGELRALCRLGLAHRDGIAHGLGPELAHRGDGAHRRTWRTPR